MSRTSRAQTCLERAPTATTATTVKYCMLWSKAIAYLVSGPARPTRTKRHAQAESLPKSKVPAEEEEEEEEFIRIKGYCRGTQGARC